MGGKKIKPRQWRIVRNDMKREGLGEGESAGISAKIVRKGEGRRLIF